MELESLDFWIKIGTTALCGAMVGVERQLRGKPAGMRTCILICMGAMVFTSLGSISTSALAQGDPTRVLGQVVTGVGFLGAGVILNRQGQVVGMTSAASIWVLAGIGSVVGFGYHKEGFALAIVTVCILALLNTVEERLPMLRRGAHRPTPTDDSSAPPEL